MYVPLVYGYTAYNTSDIWFSDNPFVRGLGSTIVPENRSESVKNLHVCKWLKERESKVRKYNQFMRLLSSFLRWTTWAF